MLTALEVIDNNVHYIREAQKQLDMVRVNSIILLFHTKGSALTTPDYLQFHVHLTKL